MDSQFLGCEGNAFFFCYIIYKEFNVNSKIFGQNWINLGSEGSGFKVGMSDWKYTLFFISLNYRKFPKYSDTQKMCCNHSKIWTMWLYHRVMSPNDADGMANSVDPDQTRSSLIWVCTVCPGRSVWKLRIITVHHYCASRPQLQTFNITWWSASIHKKFNQHLNTFKSYSKQWVFYIWTCNRWFDWLHFFPVF